jgi:hypothetical protein
LDPVAAHLVLRWFLPYKGTMKIPVQRPALFGAATFLFTVGVARLLAHLFPTLWRWHFSSGVHLHHYVFGIFILTIAGYLALVFKGPRATFGIGLLYGLGVGLTYDEFGYWVSPRYARGADVRWDTTGLLIVGGWFLIVALLGAITGRRRRRNAEAAASSSR